MTPAGGLRVELDAVSARHAAARRGAPSALRGLSLRVEPGEAVAVIGASGAGKTTLLQVLACAMPPQQGTLRLDGSDPWSLPRRELQRRRGELFLAPQVPPLPPRQRVVTSVIAGRLPGMSLWQSLRSLAYPIDIAAAHEALERFDLADKLFERVDRLSGGERQRVGLARALLAPARLWLIDEPLSALDPLRAQQAASTLVALARERSVSLVATLHQVEMALQHFPRIVGMRDGEVAFDLPAAQVSDDRLTQLYAQHEDELFGPAPRTDDAVLPLPRPPIVVHCR